MSTGRILIVDDDPQIRRAMRATLISRGYEVRDVCSGEEALDQFVPRRMTSLLDMNMPGMGGTEACRLIRQGSEIAIIMLTVSNLTKTKSIH